MTITSAGIIAMAKLVSSTWTHISLGTGTATVTLGDVDLFSVVTPRKAIGSMTASNFTVYTRTMFSALDNNSASNITEIGVFDALTSGDILFHTVASTATWTAFLKASGTTAFVSVDIGVSA